MIWELFMAFALGILASVVFGKSIREAFDGKAKEEWESDKMYGDELPTDRMEEEDYF